MYIATPAQIRAARGILDWSQAQLASAADVSRATIQNIEGNYMVRPETIRNVQDTLVAEGITFLPDGDGVKRIPEGMKDFMGKDSCDRFFDNVAMVLKASGGELFCQIQTSAALTKKTCTSHRSNIERLRDIQRSANVKCLLLNENISVPEMEAFDTKVFHEETQLATSTFTYGNELAVMYTDARGNFVYVIFQVPHLVNSSQAWFTKRWPVARSMDAYVEPRKRIA